MKGKFIVIEGTDGSGKGTQVKLLIQRLKADGVPVEMVDFPQYENPSSYFVAKYLRGEYGTAEDVGPYRASMFYALDRYDKSFEIKKWLDEGIYVIANRYVSANMGHQAGKIDDSVERDKYLEWLNNLEYKIFGIPVPDQTIFLFVPPELGQKMVNHKNERNYTNGKKMDIHEADITHLKKASEAYIYVAEKYGWRTINCSKDGVMLSREVINEEIYNAIA
ncbi:TPA: thymidylate kinase [Candidatus Nomurabacteria bacterium]|nr:thymidylate kinase [Candidatus Nomurabacteria bacterium]